VPHYPDRELVPSPRHIARNERISRTTRSCTVHNKVSRMSKVHHRIPARAMLSGSRFDCLPEVGWIFWPYGIIAIAPLPMWRTQRRSARTPHRQTDLIREILKNFHTIPCHGRERFDSVVLPNDTARPAGWPGCDMTLLHQDDVVCASLGESVCRTRPCYTAADDDNFSCFHNQDFL